MATLVNHLWKPSKARTLIIDSFVPVPRGSAAIAPAPLGWPAKDPGDILDYQLSIEPALTGNTGDSIESVDIDIRPNEAGDLSLNNISADGCYVVLWLAAGQAGTTYVVTAKIALASGRTLQRSILLPVINLSVPSIPANAIQTALGDPLVDQDGNPILYN